MGTGHAHALYVHGHSRIHRLAPETKVAAAFTFVVAVAITPREAAWAFAVYAISLVAVLKVSDVPPRFVVARLPAILPFVAFAFLIPFIASGERIDVAGVALSKEGLWATWNIVAKATLGATTSIILVATTEVPDILRGMGVLRVPRAFVSIAAFMMRYLELVVDELKRMRMAMEARGYDPRWLWQVKPIAASAGALFVRSYERGERVHAAMASRGFTGTMPVLTERQTPSGDWLVASALPALAVVVAVAALVAT
ncbi:MAG: cobalt ECF transporter T component CbiQ [Actinomycetota bacterium]